MIRFIFKCVCFIWSVWCTLSSDTDKTDNMSTRFWVYTPLTYFTSIVGVTEYKKNIQTTNTTQNKQNETWKTHTKYNTAITVLKSNRKMAERNKIDTSMI